MNGFLLACLAAAATGALLILWARAMRQLEMGKRLWLLSWIAVAAAVLGGVALARDPGVVGGLLAGVSVLAGVTFLALGFFLSTQSKQDLAVTLDGAIPTFTAPDENGEPFDIASLRGSPVLLKFFRGHW
jgi:ribose/xylose/arabinose/galactoside ABC-type transport system permease subunit